MRTKPNGVMSFTAPCARAQRAEISRRFGAPQMADRATARFRDLMAYSVGLRCWMVKAWNWPWGKALSYRRSA